MTLTTALWTSSDPSAAPVWAPVQFIRPWPGRKPQFDSAALAEDAQRFFFDTERRLACIEDVRGWSTAPDLDREGFALMRRPTAVDDLYDDAAVQATYAPEVERLVAEALGAEWVTVFDVTRRSDSPAGARNPDGVRRPAARVHVDYTIDSGPRRAADVLGQSTVRAALAAGHAIVQVNAWRPIVGPVLRSPLAFVDASTVATEDLVATDQVFPDRVGEIYHLAHATGQRWGYVSRMARDEVVLIKGYDSRTDGRARFTPHSAFELPDQDSAPARHSIEVRTFAIVPNNSGR